MGRAAGGLHSQDKPPFALNLQGPAGEGRLETKDERGRASFGFDEFIGFGTAAFLRRVDQDGDPLGRGHVHLPQRPQGRKGQDQAALHVQDARSEDFLALGVERHLGQAADRPNGIGVSQRIRPSCALDSLAGYSKT